MGHIWSPVKSAVIHPVTIATQIRQREFGYSCAISLAKATGRFGRFLTANRNIRCSAQILRLFTARRHPQLTHFAIKIGTLEPEPFSRCRHVAASGADLFFDVVNLEVVRGVRQRRVRDADILTRWRAVQ